MYDHGFSAAVVAAGDAILRDKNKSIGEIKEEFIEFCRGLNMAEDKVIHSDKILVHPKNRGGLLVNPHNAHLNGSMIRRVGAQMAELRNAVSIQMSPDPQKREDRRFV
jgi:hypothetical protein